MPWKQFAYLNALWASLAIVFVYAFVHRVTGSAWAAALAACFHFGCGFFLLLAVISEDIMPGYTLVLGAMLLAGLWFDRPSHRRVALVGALFTLGWLIEWRLMFPTLPALVLALALSEGRPARRLALIGTLVVSILAVAGIVQLLWEGHNGAMGLHDILWTGKGVTTGWAGLSADKAWMMLSGIGNYFLIVGGWVDPLSAKRAAVPLVVSVAAAGGDLRRQRRRAVAATRRPAAARHRGRLPRHAGRGPGAEPLLAAARPADADQRHAVADGGLGAAAGRAVSAIARDDGAARRVVARAACLERRPARALSRRRPCSAGGRRRARAALPARLTVFVYWGFEPITMWQYALWSRTWDWDGAVTIAPAPSADPKFKWIAVDAGAIRHPDWTAEQHAAVDQARHRPGARPRLPGRHLRRLDLERRTSWPASSAACRRPTGRRRSTGCCTTTTRRSPPSAIPLPAPTTSCVGAQVRGHPAIRSARHTIAH